MSNTFTDMQQALEALPRQEADSNLADSWLLGFDTETTGVHPGKDAIVSACLVLRDPKKGYEGDVVAEWVINPHCHMSVGASRVNGFTNEYLSEHGAEPAEAISQIASLIAQAQAKQVPLLAYNAPFDIDMVNGDIARWCADSCASFDPAHMLVVDPLVMDRAVSKRSGRRSLEYTTEYYGVAPHGNFHNAAADTIAAVDLVKPMTTLYPQLAHLTLDQLMDWQRKAHQLWVEDYQKWAKSRGKALNNFSSSWL